MWNKCETDPEGYKQEDNTTSQLFNQNKLMVCVVIT